jgi:surface antigen
MKLFDNKKSEKSSSRGKSPFFSPLVIGGAVGGGSFLFLLITIVLVITIVFSPILIAQEYIAEVKDQVSNFFEKVGNLVTLKGWCTDEECDASFDEKFYKELDKVYSSYKDNGVELNTELITATVYYNKSIGQDDISSDFIDDISDLANNMVRGSSLDYSNYRDYLIGSYISKRYSDLIKSDADKIKIVDEIMSYADYKNNQVANKNTVYSECSQVCSTDGRCFDLEEFVVRVTDHESGGFIGLTNNYAEQWKAQAVAVRSYTLNVTNSCKKAIDLGVKIDILDPSASRSQHDKIAEAIKDTKGEILTIDGKPILAMWDSFYKKNNYHCDNEFCYGTYQKIGFSGENYETHEIKTYKKWESHLLGGHGIGLSQYAAAYMADSGMKYDEIVKSFYDSRAELTKLTTVAYGNVKGAKYTSTAPLYNNVTELLSNINYDYYASPQAAGGSSSCPTYYGQCPWFAKGRAIELVSNSDMPDDLKQTVIKSLKATRGDGGQWYDNPSNELFEKSTDIYAARPGSIVSWSQAGKPGHVGIVEDVQYDENGKATKILLSEGWNKKCQVSATSYALKWWDVEQFRHYYGKHNFIGYVYLLG